MEITLMKVRQILSPAFGIDSFAVNMIRGVRANPNMPYPTMCMSEDGHMEYDPQFAQEHIHTDADLFSVITHEFLHLAFSHYLHNALPSSIEHFAIDATCNAMITHMWPKESNKGAWFKGFYAADKIPDMILRPESKCQSSIVAKLYPRIWVHSYSKKRITTVEIINVLKTLIPPDLISTVLLLGNHGGNGGEEISGIDKETAEKFLGELKRTIKKGKLAGKGGSLSEELLDLIDTNLSIRTQLLSKYACATILGHYLAPTEDLDREEMPIMLTPSQRDLIRMVNLGNIYTFHNLTEVMEDIESRGVVIYCDSSGSVTTHLPEIVSMLQRAKSQLQKIYWFSTEISEVNLENMALVRTTYGTDFTCIAESMLEHNYKKAVIFTDGHASMDKDIEEKMDKLNPEILTILFGSNPNKEHTFTNWGPTMLLEEATDTYQYA